MYNPNLLPEEEDEDIIVIPTLTTMARDMFFIDLPFVTQEHGVQVIVLDRRQRRECAVWYAERVRARRAKAKEAGRNETQPSTKAEGSTLKMVGEGRVLDTGKEEKKNDKKEKGKKREGRWIG
jgi:hypothetical protein